MNARQVDSLQIRSLAVALKALNDSGTPWWDKPEYLTLVNQVRIQIGPQPIHSEVARQYVRFRISRMQYRSRIRPYVVD